MLMPKRTKYRRPHRLSYEGRSKAGREVNFGEFGLMADTGAYVVRPYKQPSNRSCPYCDDPLYEAWWSSMDSYLPTLGNYKETVGSTYGFW